jgi:hypothetical protein
VLNDDMKKLIVCGAWFMTGLNTYDISLIIWWKLNNVLNGKKCCMGIVTRSSYQLYSEKQSLGIRISVKI